jgi:hypothetical protein
MRLLQKNYLIEFDRWNLRGVKKCFFTDRIGATLNSEPISSPVKKKKKGKVVPVLN